MTSKYDPCDSVSPGCPSCGERLIDHLVWIDDETVRCTTCGSDYRPGTVPGAGPNGDGADPFHLREEE